MSPASSTHALRGIGGGKGYCWNDTGCLPSHAFRDTSTTSADTSLLQGACPDLVAPGSSCWPGWMPGMAYVHLKVLHCSGRRGKGLGLPVGKSQEWSPPGKDSLQWMLGTPKSYLRAPIKHQFKAGYLCGSCISWRDAVRGRGGAMPGPGSCRGRVRVPQPQGYNHAHAGSLEIKDTSKQYLTLFFFSTTK